jgi:hypothetical protein
VAGVEALSTSEARKDGPELFGKLASKGKLFDATEGHNWDLTNCGTYLCNAEVGYDGPTGNGTPDGVFTVAPSVTTGLATNVTETEATLHGIVNPNGLETKYYFEYGTTESYGSKTAEASAGSGESNLEESKTITGLTPGSTYHFRIVATNGSGTTHGADQVFPYWLLQSTPNPTEATHSVLSGASCTSTSACIAVGKYVTAIIGGNPSALAEVWNGTSWSLKSVPNPSEAKSSALSGVSCTSSSACTAVGTYTNGSGTTVTLAEAWNGTSWSVQSTPNPAEATASYLNGVSCTSSSACVAVGEYQYKSGLSNKSRLLRRYGTERRGLSSRFLILRKPRVVP